MRPLVAVLIWIVLIGGLSAYMQSRERVTAQQNYLPESTKGVFSLELVTTFDAEPDPFSLRSKEDERPTALLLRVNGRTVLRETKRVMAGKVLRVEPMTGILEGKNELYLEVNPPLHQADRSHAVRVRVLRDGVTVAKRSVWSEPGGRIATTIALDVGKQRPQEENEHGH